MAKQPFGAVLRYLHRLTGADPAGPTSDRHLLERFVSDHDEAAFETLVARHGPMVLGVCRRMLERGPDVEDAFQATFLVLVRRASALAWRDSIGAWLYQVAQRVAIKARGKALRRQLRERETDDTSLADPRPDTPDDGLSRGELRRVLDEELQRLPARYRAPLVLCYLQGKTHDEAAQELGWPRGSIAHRLTRAQDLLRDRLLGRGVTLSGTVAAVLSAEQAASASMPLELTRTTVRSASLFLAGETVAVSGLSTQVTNLAEGVIQAMYVQKIKIALFALLLVGLLVGGIGWFWPAGNAADQAKKTGKPTPEQTRADKVAVAQGNTAFALDLYGKLRVREGNLFLSPYSVSTALAMTSGGARGPTLEQMVKTLRFPVDQERLHPAFAALTQDLRAGGKDYQLHIVNALWGQKGYAFGTEFLTGTQANYGAAFQTVDFAGGTEQARRTINTWVEKQTQSKIKDLFPSGILDNRTRLVLTNAIHFKSDWEVPFGQADTTPQPFFGTKKKGRAPLMTGHLDENFKYLDGGKFQAVELPYRNHKLSMVVFLPKKVDGLTEFEQTLTPAKLTEYLAGLKPRSVKIFLPKFQVTAQVDMNALLAELGMPDLFILGKANFSGMNGGKEDLFLQAVIHKAFIDVNENGTEAAAATGVAVGALSDVQAIFRADHPFFYLIRDNRSGSVLFMGRLVEPSP